MRDHVFGLAQRAAAAFRAMALRCSGVSLAARALPPLRPPRRPRATAAGFFSCLSGEAGGAFPVASSTMLFASKFKSRGLCGLSSMQGILERSSRVSRKNKKPIDVAQARCRLSVQAGGIRCTARTGTADRIPAALVSFWCIMYEAEAWGTRDAGLSTPPTL